MNPVKKFVVFKCATFGRKKEKKKYFCIAKKQGFGIIATDK